MDLSSLRGWMANQFSGQPDANTDFVPPGMIPQMPDWPLLLGSMQRKTQAAAQQIPDLPIALGMLQKGGNQLASKLGPQMGNLIDQAGGIGERIATGIGGASRDVASSFSRDAATAGRLGGQLAGRGADQVLSWIKPEGVNNLLQSSQAPTSALQQLMSREGFKDTVYKDSGGKLHVGMGHSLQGDEAKQFKEGDRVSKEQIEQWFHKDTQGAFKAAQEQARQLGNPALVEPLMHLNYQLGTNWFKEHKKTWGLLQQGDYEGAAVEAANSKWNQQTPERVQDFQAALRSLKS